MRSVVFVVYMGLGSRYPFSVETVQLAAKEMNMGEKMIMTRQVERSEIRTTNVEFGQADERGRKIGAKIREDEVRMEALPEDHHGAYSTLAPGLYFVLRTQATRNGLEYGATQMARHFTTEVERIHALGSYLRTAELRAMKKAKVQS